MLYASLPLCLLAFFAIRRSTFDILNSVGDYMTTQYEIGVIGAGNAAEGIVHGILRNTILFADRMIASDPVEARRRLFAERFDVAVTTDNRYLV